jgi:hypothetical protein
MVSNVSKQGETRESYLQFIGDEWSEKEALTQVLDDYFFPHLTEDSIVAEIGSGGGL